jgi:excisionase family DNA binding protein
MTMPTEASGASSEQVEPFIKKAEVARRIGMSVRTVDNWMRRRQIPFYRIRRSVMFRWSEVQAHLAATCRVNGRGGSQ